MRLRERLAPHVVIIVMITLGLVGIATAVWVERAPSASASVPGPDGLIRRSARAAKLACAPEALGPLAWTGLRSAVDAQDALVVLITNNLESRCTITGSARLIAKDPHGRRIWVPVQAGTLPVSVIAQFPATIDAGEPARLVITPAAHCGASRPVRYTKLSLVVDGRELPVAGTEAFTACAVLLSDWHVIPPVLNHP